MMLGGADTQNLSLQIIEQLQDLKIEKIVVHNNLQTAKKLESFEGVRVLYKPNDNELIKAMKESSLAITTASMSSYELAYLQIPSILIALNKNQQDGITQLLSHNIASDAVSITDENYLEKLKNFILRKEFTFTNRIDGKGVERIHKILTSLLSQTQV